jgi:hypothetical protein
MKFVLDNLHEAQVAHIVPKNKNGTDDPRNGLTLCRAHHWAFDAGLFTLASDYTVVVSPLVERADSRKFEMASLAGQALHRPQREVIHPHPVHPTPLRCGAMVSQRPAVPPLAKRPAPPGKRDRGHGRARVTHCD